MSVLILGQKYFPVISYVIARDPEVTNDDVSVIQIPLKKKTNCHWKSSKKYILPACPAEVGATSLVPLFEWTEYKSLSCCSLSAMGAQSITAMGKNRNKTMFRGLFFSSRNTLYNKFKDTKPVTVKTHQTTNPSSAIMARFLGPVSNKLNK